MRYLVASDAGFFSALVILAVTDCTTVKNVPIFGYGETAHRLILFGEPVKKLVKFARARRGPP